MKPNYLVIGAAKCGSTTISELLGLHPDIYMVPDEVEFFASDKIYENGIDWYENLFLPGKNLKCIGENSNKYTMKERHPLVLDRLLEYFDPSSLKLIYIVRNPLEMIESFWIEKRSHGGEDVHYDFNVAVKKNRDWLTDSANYWQQITHYRKYFPDKNIYIIFLEDLKLDQTQTMRGCYDFLGADPEFASSLVGKRLNPSTSKMLTKPIKSRLRELKIYQLITAILPVPIKKYLVVPHR